jgi:hypothetical protein
MSHRIIVLDEAEDELIAAQRWYETQRAGLGQEFRKAIDEAMDRLAEAPLTASPIVNPLTQPIETRRMLVKRFPYSIIFVEYKEDLWITASQRRHSTARGQFVEPNRVGNLLIFHFHQEQSVRRRRRTGFGSVSGFQQFGKGMGGPLPTSDFN